MTTERTGADAEIIYGRNPVQLCLQQSPRKSFRLWIDREMDPRMKEKFSRLGRGRSVQIQLINKGQIDRMTHHAVHQGVALEVEPLKMYGLGKLIQKASAGRLGVAALDGITDPQNFGAICRNAEALGLDGILFESRHSPPLGGAAYKASAGAIDLLPLCGVPNLSESVRALKSKGVKIIGLDANSKRPLTESPPPEQVCFVLGSEDRGMKPGLRSMCDGLYAIPMRGKIGSLNVSAAAAVTFFWWASGHSGDTGRKT